MYIDSVDSTVGLSFTTLDAAAVPIAIHFYGVDVLSLHLTVIESFRLLANQSALQLTLSFRGIHTLLRIFVRNRTQLN